MKILQDYGDGGGTTKSHTLINILKTELGDGIALFCARLWAL